jgi:hypothetical protein
MKKSIFIISLLLYTTTVFSQHKNILISTSNNPNEPTIIIDPKNPSQLIAATNLNNYYISSDTGKTWNENTLSSSFGVWGDPVVIVDTSSNFYYFHLSNPPTGNWIDRIVCQKSVNNGSTWSDGTYTGLNGIKAQDKQWSVVDRRNNHIYMTWTQFDTYGSADPNDSSIILFSKSTDGAQTWSTPLRINVVAGDCIDEDNTTEGAVPAVGPNGEVYVTWTGPAGLRFNRSTDEGNTWLPTNILIDPMPGGWDYTIPGIQRANGLPITVCDVSNSMYKGTIYVNWSDQRNGTNDTDIWFSKSTDGGNTWTAARRVNNDGPGRHQFFTWMTIDQTNGYLYFVFYDRRNTTASQTEVYMAQSKDGGETFTNFKISESPFTPNSSVFFGDYTNVTAHNNIIRPIWTRLHGGNLSIHTAIINTDSIAPNTSLHQEKESLGHEQNFPNPFSEETFISFKIHSTCNVSLIIYNEQGKEITKVIDGKKYNYGKYIEKIDPVKLNLKPGTYFYKLYTDKEMVKNKMIYIH